MKVQFAPIKRTTLTVDEVAKYLGLSKDMIYKLVREKAIPCVRVGRRILFRIHTIDEWLDEQERGSYGH